MIQVTRRKVRRASGAIVFLAIIAGVAGLITAMANMSTETQAPTTEKQVLVTETASSIALTENHVLIRDNPSTSKPEATPKPFEPDPVEVEMLAKTIWGEARGIQSTTEKAAVVWCVLNRVDSDDFPCTVPEVLTQKNQFAGYSARFPATEEHKAIAADVLTRWHEEKQGAQDAGRVLPIEYTFFTGDGEHNHFRTEYRQGDRWDWSLPSPYEN